MTRKISRPVFAMALAFGLLAAIASPGHAALSTADRTEATVAPVPAQAQPAALAAVSTPAPVPAAVATTPPVAAVTAPVVQQPRKAVATKIKPRRFATAPRFGYPCH